MDTLAGYGTGSSDSDASDSSLDSAAERAAEARARLRDFGEDDLAANPAFLPSASAAFGQVDGPPSFLDPEATRPLAAPAALSRSGLAAAAADGSGSGSTGGRMTPGPGFDISVLAPKLKGTKRPVDPRDMPSGALIESKARLYREDDGPEATQQYSAMMIAMLGGKTSDKPSAGGAAARGPSTKPMEVSEFLNKGIGAAALPRRAQDRKDKEKEKRAKGQSAIGSWKTEAEMVLRQQYD